MGFQPGNKHGKGRPAGAGNKVTEDLRRTITDFLQDNYNDVIKEWKKLEGVNKVNFWRDLLKYSVPQLASVEMTSELEALTDEQLNILYEKLRDEMNANMNHEREEE